MASEATDTVSPVAESVPAVPVKDSQLDAPAPQPPEKAAESEEPEPQNALTEKFTEQEWTALKEFRKQLPETLADAYSDAKEARGTPVKLWGVELNPDGTKSAKASVVLMKFLRARNLSVSEAREMLVNTLRWRESFKLDEVMEEQFDEKLFGRVGHIYGKDKEGRPVVYNVYGGNTKDVFSDVQRFIRWRVQFMEKSVLLLDFENTDQMIQVHDYEGVGLRSRDANSITMRSSFLLPVVAASVAVAQQVNTTYVTGLVNALNSAGLTSLVSALTPLTSNPQGQALVSQLPNGTRTVFAPNNDALNGYSGSPSADTIAYHILTGNFSVNGLSTDPTHTIGRTFLNDSNVVQLEGGKSQVLAFDKWSNGSVSIINQPGYVFAQNNTITYENLLIYIIPAVLHYPDPISETIGNLSSFQSLVNQAGALPALEAAHGITIFAPNNDAISNAQNSLNGANSSTVLTVLGNHIINGTSVYSSQLGSGFTSASGEGFSFNTNSSGTFVTSGSSTARIVQTDTLVENGVIHVIDGVLLNTQSNPSAAASAYSAATSSAASATSSPSGPVGSAHNAAPASIGVTPWCVAVVACGIVAGTFFTL